MKGGTRPLGYTIIEVMIVLAVSGLMFVIAANFISGKQQKTAFTQGTNEFAAQIQTVVSQVTDGQYTDIPFTCTSDGSNLTIDNAVVKSANPDCVFMGKFIHFNEGGDVSKYEVFSLAGARTADEYKDALITPIISNGADPDFDLTTHQIVPQSLEVRKISVTVGTVTHNDVHGIGFVQGLGSTDDNGYVTGSQTISMVYAPNLTTGDANEETAQAELTHGASTSPVVTINTATICVTDGTRFAKILLGGSDTNSASQLAVKVKVTTSCDD